MPDWRSKSFLRNSAKVFFILSLALVVTSALPAPAQDTQPPVLTSFTFSPMAVNTTTSPATVNVTAQVTDNLSGVRVAYAEFVSPSGDQATEAGLALTSGTDLNGTWTGSAVIPAYSEAGTWTVSYVYVQDYVGNAQDY